MEKKPGIRLVFVLIITGIFFIPLYPSLQWFSLDRTVRENAEMKYEFPKKYLDLPYEDQKDIDSTKELKNKTIKLGLDLQGGMYIALKADTSGLEKDEDKRDAVSRALEVIRNRVDQFGVSEPSIMKQGTDRIVVELPGVKDPKRAEDLLNVRGKLEFMLVDDTNSEFTFLGKK